MKDKSVRQSPLRSHDTIVGTRPESAGQEWATLNGMGVLRTECTRLSECLWVGLPNDPRKRQSVQPPVFETQVHTYTVVAGALPAPTIVRARYIEMQCGIQSGYEYSALSQRAC